MTNENLTPVLISGVSCYERDGTAYLRLEDVARGLGFTQTQNKNGVEYTSIRWETINRYLEEIGFPNKLGKDSYIPENIFYRLAMKAKNETAEKFQALVADEIIPQHPQDRQLLYRAGRPELAAGAGNGGGLAEQHEADVLHPAAPRQSH